MPFGLNPPLDQGPLRLHSSQEGTKFLLTLIADLAQQFSIVPQQLNNAALYGDLRDQTVWRFQRQCQIVDLRWSPEGPIRMELLSVNPMGHLDGYSRDPVLWWAPPKTNGIKLGYHRARLFKHLGKQTGEPAVHRLGPIRRK